MGTKKSADRPRARQNKLKDVVVPIYLEDPSSAEFLIGKGIKYITLPGESCIGDGPTSARVAIVDYNADLDQVFAPVRKKKDGTGFVLGAGNPVANLQFHQAHVWGVVNHTLNLLEGERIFGRTIPWAFDRGRLLVLPHAGYWENAFYSRSTGALHFFYFQDKKGKPVYTCLSRDIVTHELGHAVLDGLKPYYNEISSPATAGFHEYFGDAIAMTSSLSFREIVVPVVARCKGDLSVPNFISNIAQEFGQAVSGDVYGSLADSYLRTGLNTKTMVDVQGEFEEHKYSEVLTGVYYDLLRVYYKKLLQRHKREGRRAGTNLYVAALIDAASLVGRVLFRALDYCPPVDIDYSDYAGAVWRADSIAYPLDPGGFREAAMRVFEKRKIAPPGWGGRIRNSKLRDLDVELIGASRTDAYKFIDANRGPLSIPHTANLSIVHVYRTRKVSADGYRPPQELIVEFVWPVDVMIRGSQYGSLNGKKATLWCGGTLVFDLNGNLLHYTSKQDEPRRRQQLLEYIAYLVRSRALQVADGEEGLGAKSTTGSRISATISGGDRVQLTRTAAMRHMG